MLKVPKVATEDLEFLLSYEEIVKAKNNKFSTVEKIELLEGLLGVVRKKEARLEEQRKLRYAYRKTSLKVKISSDFNNVDTIREEREMSRPIL